MSIDHELSLGRSRGTSHVGTLATGVMGERRFFHAAMNSGFFEGFEGSRLSVRQTWLDPALGESPASAPSLNQQEFDAASSVPVANSSDMFAYMSFVYFWRRKKGLDLT